MITFEDRVKEIRAMPSEEFEKWIDERKSENRSFPGLYPPINAKYLGFVQRENIRTVYYMDDEGEIFYETDAGYRWKKQMENFKHKRLMEGR